MSSGEIKDTVNEPAVVEPAAGAHAVVMAESKGYFKLKTRTGRLTAGVLSVFIMAAAVAGYQLSHPASACSDSFLKSAGMHFDGQHRSELINDVAEIQAKKEYIKDPNCLYVVMEYNIHSSDSAKATQTYALLQKAYDPAKGFSHSLGPNLQTMADFKKSLSFLKQYNAELLRNSFGIPQP
jgi:hypothetical protein